MSNFNNMATKHSIDVIIDIPFHDVDSAQIAWHGHYAKYFEVARCALLETINYNYLQMSESGYFWPVVDMRIRYINPALFSQKVRVNATITEWENRLRIDYKIFDAESSQRLTKGYTIQVAVDMESRELQLASPAVLLRKLGVDETI
ncbi:1,4-dihydroxy-2-naphthoyl-CoA hydrolase [Zhongshania aliphaticivorans]|uniref:1,4-dihydroxy-2-naphthoyl-CoA hydrolase n=1 Tax=Zhongshania aliphaticivorans TaxID=1470434 RepID=A0A5S9P605_9GAMM|nr:thioesterase family protein [Zhongshania aliphaticivorans]CAA0091602.1 1,4-dihydroxy-2-naphthoyl-CoA hydrolase [Zhongshania aliphaticivorans]CAA0098950.1 1,4-dihydroxy-2-naphthoyl-CoA hydrolase [Zhongshania aliphaticivorans]